MSDRPNWMQSRNVTIAGVTYYTRPLNDDHCYDRIEVTQAERWKESELSGDEYRWSYRAVAVRKGIAIAAYNQGDLLGALLRLIPELNRLARWRYLGVDECAQPACANEPVVLYRIIRPWSANGTLAYTHDSKYVRGFCGDHTHRGDCGMDDNDANYEPVGLRADGEWAAHPALEAR